MAGERENSISSVIDDFVKTVRKDLEMNQANSMIHHFETGFKIYFRYGQDARIEDLKLKDERGEFLKIGFREGYFIIEGIFLNKDQRWQNFILRFPAYKWKYKLYQQENKYIESPNIYTKIIGYKELLIVIDDNDIRIF